MNGNECPPLTSAVTDATAHNSLQAEIRRRRNNLIKLDRVVDGHRLARVRLEQAEAEAVEARDAEIRRLAALIEAAHRNARIGAATE